MNRLFIFIDVDLMLMKLQTNFSFHGIWRLINFATRNVWGSDLWPDRTLALALATSQLWSGLYTLCFLIYKVLWIMTCFNEDCIIWMPSSMQRNKQTVLRWTSWIGTYDPMRDANSEVLTGLLRSQASNWVAMPLTPFRACSVYLL